MIRDLKNPVSLICETGLIKSISMGYELCPASRIQCQFINIPGFAPVSDLH
jgi:hypothetical protein